MKTTWRLLFAVALLPVGGVAQAAGYLDGAMKSPASFDEALGSESIELVSMLEPDPAEPAAAAAPKAAASGSCCGSVGDCCGDSCSGDPCCGDMCNACCGPTWTFRGGAVILERDRNDRTRFIRDNNGGAQDGFADQFDPGYSGGVDLSLIRWLECGKSIESRFFGGLEWEDRQRWDTSTNWGFGNIPDWTNGNAISVTTDYSSRLNSAEVNLRSSANRSITYLIGFRWIELNEDFSANANILGAPLAFRLDTDNNLYGGQIGADANLLRTGGPLTANAWIKAGVYGNDADSSFSLTTPGPDFANSASNGQVAFVGDVAITSSYALNDWLSLRTGYQLLWIEGVAIASDQITLANLVNGGVDSEGEAFYHGALISLDATW
ncbi:MAG: BBP7 family outer membrane beta-barrel protein [Pirellulales bacterium]|nr:BBP7 family outer membrane beta-barrel protein [Pirellulales bacterium]